MGQIRICTDHNPQNQQKIENNLNVLGIPFETAVDGHAVQYTAIVGTETARILSSQIREHVTTIQFK